MSLFWKFAWWNPSKKRRCTFRMDSGRPGSALALGAVVGSAASQHHAPDGRLAAAAGLAGALVDAVLELKEAPLAIGVDIIGDRGATKPDGVVQNLAQRQPKTLEFGSSEAVSPPSGPDAGLKQALVGIDVAHAGQ